jgi:hypothetical protein
VRELSKRGNLVAGIAIGLIIAAIYYLSGHLWWTGEEWCLDTMANCMDKAFTR